ncbi:aminoglycoside phosphotransferase family protein [Candidatus Eisenbacteria bacterium]|uniref:Aminoglycoside phosphotransferase family protein n=1 Tax=Eiseniibacteriota bacterium TaxID=2212470 RepID=A0ABV6YI44_UNCEI
MSAAHMAADLRPFVERVMPLLAGTEPAVPDQADAAADRLQLTPLAGDGSNRKIFRAALRGVTAVAVSNPLAAERVHPDDNESFYAVQDHLKRCKVRVPAIFAADTEHGMFLLEDLGDVRLYDLVRAGEGASDPAQRCDPEILYNDAVDVLVRIQAAGGPIFDPESVGNPPYDERFVLEEEARYFHDELIRGLAGIGHAFVEIEAECRQLAWEAISGTGEPSADAPVFMHRDFQSRNLMVAGGSLIVIDFQGARLGPPQYDLASLLLDPYAALPAALREKLLLRYLRGASDHHVPGTPAVDANATSLQELGPQVQTWFSRFLANGANRLMQALGAYAKLGGRLHRPGFLENISTGLRLLESVLQQRGDCARLLELVYHVLAESADTKTSLGRALNGEES